MEPICFVQQMRSEILQGLLRAVGISAIYLFYSMHSTVQYTVESGSHNQTKLRKSPFVAQPPQSEWS
jgi:hypothetical protein